MKVWYNNLLATDRFVANIQGERLRVGRGAENDIVLDSPFVADRAAEIRRREDTWEIVALGINGCVVGERRVSPGERHCFSVDQTIRIFPFSLSLQCPPDVSASESQQRTQWERDLGLLVRDIHAELLSLMDIGNAVDTESASDEYLLALEGNIEEIAQLKGLGRSKKDGLINHIAGVCVRSKLIEQLIDQSSQSTARLPKTFHWSNVVSSVPHLERALDELVEQISERLSLSSQTDLSVQMEVLERAFWTIWDPQSEKLLIDFRLYLAARHLKKQIKDIVFGYGPLEDLLRMPTITEIMVVDRDRIFIEKNGVVENSGRRFISDEVTLTIIERIVSKVGRRIDKSQPLVDARLADGSRVNAIIPPLAVSGPCVTIRKFPEQRLLMKDLVDRRTLSQTAAEFLKACVIRRRNILVAGGTGTGKTTLLNCLSDCIPSKERIVTIEDTAELQISKEHVVRLETKTANSEGTGAYSIHDLVRNALRMRPDRIVVGECRGPEALDMLQAMNTGHDGSLTTVHANSASDVILRLEVMVQSRCDMPIQSIHRQIVSAIDLIVQLARFRDGSRRVVQITEVVAMDEDHGGIVVKDIFKLDGERPECELRPTGRLPSFLPDLIASDLVQLESLFR